MPTAHPSSHRRSAALVAVTVLVVAAACSRDRRAGGAAAAAPPATSAPANSSAGSARDQNPIGLIPLPEDRAAREVRNYQLTVPALQKWAAGQRAFGQLYQAHRDVFAALETAAPPRTVDEMIARIDSQPLMRRALATAGTSPHDYIVTMLVMNQAMEGYRNKMTGKAPSSGVPQNVLDNMAFVEKNMPAIQQALASIPH